MSALDRGWSGTCFRAAATTAYTPADTRAAHATAPMRILLLSEGNAETGDSWSGSSRSLLHQLRSLGHSVVTGDVDLYGVDRWRTMALTFSAKRKRWAARYHLGDRGYQARSEKAAEVIARHRGRIDLILQIGATFEARSRGPVPYAMYCDSNIAWAQRGSATGYTDAVHLSAADVARQVSRETSLYRGASLIFTMSGRLKSSFEDDFGIPSERVVPIYAGPNCDVGTIPPRPPRQATQPPTVLFVGKQFERKGGPLLLEAFARVRERVPDARLRIIGPTELAGLPEGVECLGFISKDRPGGWEEIAAAYQSADVFCLPTRFEPFGIVFVEAMHFGLPCVGPEAWAVPEIISDGETGFTVPPDDAAALADALVRLISDPSRARHMGAVGRQRALQQFTWEAAAKRMSDAMTSLRPAEALRA